MRTQTHNGPQEPGFKFTNGDSGCGSLRGQLVQQLIETAPCFVRVVVIGVTEDDDAAGLTYALREHMNDGRQPLSVHEIDRQTPG